MKFLYIAPVLALGLFGSLNAQERAAGSNADTQMTWSALSTMVKDSNAKTAAVDVRMNQSIVCNRKFMLYAPGPGADGDGCIHNGLIVDLTSRVKLTEDSILKLQGDLKTLESYTKTQVVRIDGNVAALTAVVDKLDGRVGKNESDISKLRADVTSINTQISTINGKVTQMVSDIAGIDKRLDTAEKSIATHTSQIAKNTGDISEINGSITRLNADIAAIKAAAAALAGKVSDNTDDIQKIVKCGQGSQFFNGANCVKPNFGTAVLDLKFKTFVFENVTGNVLTYNITPYVSGLRFATMEASEASAERRCEELGYQGTSGMGTTNYDGPGPNTNNRNAYWNGNKWVVVSAYNSKYFMLSLTCYKASLK